PPAGFSYIGWLALLPLLVFPMPKERLRRILCAFSFGYAHFAIMLHWLNEVGFGAGYILSIYCALYPAIWYYLAGSIFKRITPADIKMPDMGLLHISQLKKGCICGLALAVLWVTLEWLRGILFTGFPWGMLGISQYKNTSILRIVSYTGVYGISFMMILCNCTFAIELCRAIHVFKTGGKLCKPLHYYVMAAFTCLALLPIFEKIPDVPESAPMLKLCAIQGNIPQCREWTLGEYQYALDTYVSLSKKAHSEYKDLDLIMWPECAVPSSIDYQPYKAELIKLQSKTNTPLLLGALQMRLQPGDSNHENANTFNSVFLLDEKAHIVAGYDKMHRVPFGEYVPLSDMYPWLREAIGLGRDLTPGSVPFVFNLAKGTKAGVNICFEDVFPAISRAFTRKGANMLMTVTNDSWYNQSCGAEQHTAHVVFRAVENRRPFMRSGNNSHTLMVTPAGKIMGQITANDSVFTQDYQAYEVPVFDGWGDTFYTKYGDVFAYVCVIACAAMLAIMLAKSCSTQKPKSN
ncbi:MAG: apolipoprotein N-acyltransferase, partial [Victivallales bacterium]|nr:apolipoprotein N-acyltransferase [Victivallales bacterium]